MRIKVKLADAKARLPDPTRHFMLAPADVPFEVDDSHPFWIGALGDGSVVPIKDDHAPDPVKPAAKE